jgi:hypothetical protein
MIALHAGERLADQGYPQPHVRERFEERWRGHCDYPQLAKSAYVPEQHLQAARLRASARPYVLETV